VTVTLHDVRGRQVRTLLAGEVQPAGLLRLNWDGLDSEGRALASGMYLARVQAGARTASVKLMLAR
jgi:flagellar hook assembly protein FlgD